MRPILSNEEKEKVNLGPKTDHEKYIKKCERLHEMVDNRLGLADWKELYKNEEEGVYAW
jgi:hypothetical protein